MGIRSVGSVKDRRYTKINMAKSKTAKLKKKETKASEEPWVIHLSSGDVVVGPDAVPIIPPKKHDPEEYAKLIQELTEADVFGFEDREEE